VVARAIELKLVIDDRRDLDETIGAPFGQPWRPTHASCRIRGRR
jgi:hypothetical protein